LSTPVPDAPAALTEASRRVAIYGGAFDPPHLAHVFTLTWLLQRTDLDEIWLLPAAAHAFGKRLTPFEDRVGMLAAIVAALGSTRLHICTIEHEVTLSGRTYDTLEALQARHPRHQFRLVIGADNLSEAHRWHRFEDLVARWSVIALGRPGHEASLARFAQAPWCTAGPTLPEISSTRLRAALGGGTGDPEAQAWLPGVCQPWIDRLYRQPAPAGPRVWILGAGRLGRTLAAALRAGGVPVAGLWNRSPRAEATAVGPLPASLEADVWVLAVSDPAIGALAQRLAEHPSLPAVALHCAGRLDATVLGALAARGVAVGSLHPLQALGDDPGALRGTWCAVEGDEAACIQATALVRAMGGLPVSLPAGGKVAWHAAAVLSANFVAVLTAGALELLASLGIAEADGRALLNPLQRGTLARLAQHPAAEALTGPFARGDWAAVAAHVQVLAERAPNFLECYQSLARTTARWLQWSPAVVQALENALQAP